MVLAALGGSWSGLGGLLMPLEQFLWRDLDQISEDLGTLEASRGASRGDLVEIVVPPGPIPANKSM